MSANQDDPRLEAVAKAIYGVKVKQAIDQMAGFKFDASDAVGLVTRLASESETAQVLIFYSYLDDRFQALLKLHMQHLDSKQNEDRLFGLNGPLSTFSSRIQLAYHLGWISDATRKHLDAFRKIRNEFAHRAFKTSSSDPVIAQHFSTLHFDIKSVLLSTFPNDKDEDMERLNTTLCRLVFLALNTFQELMIFPVAQAHQVHPNSIGAWANAPEQFKLFSRDMIRALLSAANLLDGPSPAD
jgi:hypothetical protein